MRPGGDGPKLVVVRSRMFKVEEISEAGELEVLDFLCPGEQVCLPAEGDVGLFVTALEPAFVCELDVDAAAELVPDPVALLEEILRRSLDQALRFGRRPAPLRKASLRLWSFLADLARRMGVRSGPLPLPMSREDLANHLSMRPETLSRAFADLVGAGRLLRVTSRDVVLA